MKRTLGVEPGVLVATADRIAHPVKDRTPGVLRAITLPREMT